MITASSFVQQLADLVASILKKDKAKAGKALIPAAYTSGNPTLQEPEETAATVGSRTAKLLQPYAPWGHSAPAASDPTVRLQDSEGNRILLGKLVDLSSDLWDAQEYGSVGWVQPGAAATLDSADTERSNATTTYATVKRFIVDRPGKFRIACRMAHTTAGSGNGVARVQIVANGQTILASADPGASSNSAHPTFNAKTIDMTVVAWPFTIVEVQIKDTTGAGTAYIDTCSITYSPATGAQAPYHAVLQD